MEGRGWGGGKDSEAASFDPDPFSTVAWVKGKGLCLLFLGPKATDFHRSFQNRVGSGLKTFLGCKKRLLAPEQVAFWDSPW